MSKPWFLHARRHMLAESATDTSREADLNRLPSVEGYGQTHALAKRLKTIYTHSFSSPAKRAKILNAALSQGSDIQVVQAFMYPHPDEAAEPGASFARVFAEIKKQGLPTNVLLPLIGFPDWPMLVQHGQKAFAELASWVPGFHDDDVVLLTGHFPDLPLLMLAAVGGVETKLGQQVIETPLRETAGYTARFENSNAVELVFED